MSQESKKQTNESPINESFFGEKLIPFGKNTIHMPSLLKDYLSVRTKSGKWIKTHPSKPISPEFKQIMIDLIFRNKFIPAKYDELSEEERKLFDETCTFCKLHNYQLETRNTIKQRRRRELTREFDIYKGELLAGNNNPEIIKKLRNLLMTMRSEGVIEKTHYNKLMEEILACL